MVLALVLAIFVPLISGQDFRVWLYRALTFLVISCPCALVLSVPLSFFGGIGGAARRGIMIKGGNYLELLADVQTVAFDKTGTLTTGQFKLTDVLPQPGFSEKLLLRCAAQAESASNHPLARAIVGAYCSMLSAPVTTAELRSGSVGLPPSDDEGPTLPPWDEDIRLYAEHAGYGVHAKADGRDILCGNRCHLEQRGVVLPESLEAEERGVVLPESLEAEERGESLVFVAIDGEFAGQLLIRDTVKPTATKAVSSLKELGIERVVLLTGDRQEAAEALAREIKLDDVVAQLLPQDKIEHVERLKAEKSSGQGCVLYVGDGINDAPVLASADLGVAMGALGADAAIEAADVVIMNDDPLQIAQGIRIARKTVRIVRQNVGMALVIKVAFLLLGAFGQVGMWQAVFADSGVAVLAVLNALRALRG